MFCCLVCNNEFEIPIVVSGEDNIGEDVCPYCYSNYYEEQVQGFDYEEDEVFTIINKEV